MSCVHIPLSCPDCDANINIEVEISIGPAIDNGPGLGITLPVAPVMESIDVTPMLDHQKQHQ